MIKEFAGVLAAELLRDLMQLALEHRHRVIAAALSMGTNAVYKCATLFYFSLSIRT